MRLALKNKGVTSPLFLVLFKTSTWHVGLVFDDDELMIRSLARLVALYYFPPTTHFHVGMKFGSNMVGLVWLIRFSRLVRFSTKYY